MDLTYGINPHQSVDGMVKDYQKQQQRLDAEAKATEPQPKEEMEPNREAERMVNRGRLNPVTGAEIPLTDKARTIMSWVPSERFLQNFDQIAWNN